MEPSNTDQLYQLGMAASSTFHTQTWIVQNPFSPYPPNQSMPGVPSQGVHGGLFSTMYGGVFSSAMQAVPPDTMPIVPPDTMPTIPPDVSGVSLPTISTVPPDMSGVSLPTMPVVSPDMTGFSPATVPPVPPDTVPAVLPDMPHRNLPPPMISVFGVPDMSAFSLPMLPVGSRTTVPGVPPPLIPMDSLSTIPGRPPPMMPDGSLPMMPDGSFPVPGAPPPLIPVDSLSTIPGFPPPTMSGILPPTMQPGLFSTAPGVSPSDVVFDARRSIFNQMNEEQLPKDQSNMYEDVSEAGDDDNQSQATAEIKMKIKEEAIIVKVHFLMHAFGDVNYPLDKSVLLMYKLLKSQMILLIRYCEDIVEYRETETITHEEILFLMRKNRALLRRLLQFLYLKDCGKHILPGFAEYRGTKIIPQEAKSVYKCIEFLNSIENFTGELTCLFCDKKVFDSVLQKRLERRYLIENSRNIFAQNWFKSTLGISLHDYAKELQVFTTHDITPVATWIIEFLALETIAGLVEKALYLRSRKYEKKLFKLLQHLDFSCPLIEFDDSDDDFLEDDAASHDVKFSFIPRKYLKERNCIENNEGKISNDQTFYQDSELTVLSKVVLFPTDSKPKYLPEDFIQRSGHPPLNVLMKKDSEKELIPKNPITPDEIQAAFIHYQRPSPATVHMIPKPPYTEKRKTKLICLALPHEEFEEDT